MPDGAAALEAAPGAGEGKGRRGSGMVLPEAGGTYWSARAIASGSGGGIMKQTPGALMVSPVVLATSQRSPPFLCRV